MLSRKNIRRANRQMRLYGEIKGGALGHLASKVMGFTPEETSTNGLVVAETEGQSVRVWDESRRAHFVVTRA